jgi:protein-disulfide isomerase
MIMAMRKHLFTIPTLVNICLGLVLLAIPVQAKAPEFLIQADDVVRGDPKAPITMVEYSDFTCHFCQKFFQETFPKLLSEYIETGKVRFVYRDFPRGLGSPLRAADAARCAGEQQAYWPMHDRLFNSDGQFSPENLKQFATELKLKEGQFSQCLETHKYFPDIEKDLKDAGTLGIRGTPAFVIFPTNVPDDPNLILIPGAFPYETFKEEIDKLLNLQSTSGSKAHASS